MLVYLFLTAAVFMGWSLGSNAANVLGPAVSTKMLTYRAAVTIVAVFICIGAFIGGDGNLSNVARLAAANGAAADNVFDSALIATIILVSAGLVVVATTFFRFPISANQSITGAVIGWGCVYADSMTQNIPEIVKFFSTWLVSPLAAGIVCFLLVKFSDRFVAQRINDSPATDKIIKWGYIISGAFSAYSLGTNASANVTALYYGQTNLLTDARLAATLGGISIALGVLTFSKRVMTTVGEGISSLNPVNGFIVVLSSAFALQFFSSKLVGINIPVSASQAMVGAVMGAGLTKGKEYVNFKALKKIFLAWIWSPLGAGILTYIIGSLMKGYFTR